MENPVLLVLAGMSLVLMVAVSGGILYLTTVEWRDKRLQQKEKKAK